MTTIIELSALVPQECRGQRFDQIAANLFPDYSRARLQGWIKAGELTVNGAAAKAKDKLFGGESLVLKAELESEQSWQAENIELDIVHEDDHLMVINKPAGLVVHPAAGNYTGTMVNALLHHAPQMAELPRAGIVHRLDKDTTGLMMVAKTLAAHHNLVSQLQARTVSREYEAVAIGQFTGPGKVNAPIGRHPKQRKQMAVVPHSGKPAVTHYSVLQRYTRHAHLRLKLETGRTHQIRVHMAHINHPLVGDPVYGGRFKRPAGISPHLADVLRQFSRQALHAAELGLVHPATGEYRQWSAPLPLDMQTLLTELEQDHES
ncbi:23S rRNA pseudouridine(1911/1915/1917) synthase RluD [Gilvimarinus agarilyticus]|uniref:23S rRNA pseudouridine(1911/1915/1917) synthase RluD n=1 Tax=unclassified Gilvimarinus TaxID=2642066 RepID=UPI001C0A0B06|nr:MULTISPECIES: 23S rRNA pseudouridine(1911/1915/1917) synthase RluD [unclassified Gilvimarinus]MBU2885201.1 23S rRNA pseudouridine(1911/1915/1917) synthase RluD [Gilvimarinus agarilyticus]MDO6570098.1 23S rRNA pseudouridine(1911/1915/1917) synthase RluD [Gilvimarinus sp. 2_MG-2023]MDO6748270.1 23S rRNA pseudouridine(1911/1915/1917) synthase RluD [Gilvimarinus sp. 1_MG-2023]